MCWTLCAKKNLKKNSLLLTDEDAFKVWVIFNFLSEDNYPLIIVPEEVRDSDFSCKNIHIPILSEVAVYVLVFTNLVWFMETILTSSIDSECEHDSELLKLR